jgi:hypothetical protein
MKALIGIQAKLKAPKKQFNSFGKYSFRSCEDILEAVKPLCIEAGALLTISDEVVSIGELFVKATATFIHEDFKHEVSAYAMHAKEKKGMDVSQISGAASSYARKYALNGLFLIDDSKDSDVTEKPIQKKKLQKLPANKFKDAVSFLKGGKSMTELKTYYDINEEQEFELTVAAE